MDRPLPGGPIDYGQQQYQALLRADAAAGPPTQEEVIAEGYYLHPPHQAVMMQDNSSIYGSRVVQRALRRDGVPMIRD